MKDRKAAHNSTFAIGGLSSPKKVLDLQKICIFECAFMLENPPIANLQNVIANAKVMIK